MSSTTTHRSRRDVHDVHDVVEASLAAAAERAHEDMEIALADLEHEQLGGLLDGVALTFSEAASLAEEYADLATEQDEQAAGYRRRLEAIDVPVAGPSSLPAWNPADPDQLQAHVEHLAGLERDGLRMRSLARAADACVARAGHYRALTQRLHEHAGRVVGPSVGADPGD